MAFLRRYRAAAGALCVGVVFLCPHPGIAQSDETAENDLKAAFLYNFAKYVEWPPAAFSGANVESFRICVRADPVFIRSIDAIVAGESIHGRRVIRSVPSTIEEVRGCHILFVGRAELDGSQRLLAATAGSPVLTVSDHFDFLKRGGTIAFVRDGTRIRFDVNAMRAQIDGLTISSRLLRVARRVMRSS